MGELEQIRVFAAVLEEASFAGAARRLAMTPASVTRSVAALEERLGVQLLVRTTRRVSPTSAGAVYAARIAPLSQALEKAAEEAREAQGVASGLLRLSAPLSLGLRVLPPLLTRFSKLHPGIRVATGLSDGFVDIVAGDYDLAIRISGPPSDKSTIWRKICEIRRALVASPQYLARRGIPAAPDELDRHDCLGYGLGSHDEVWDLSGPEGRRASHAARGPFSANNGEVLCRLAVDGHGIALLPRFIVDEDLAAGRLVTVLPRWSPPPIWLTLYYPPYERLPLRVTAFSDFFDIEVRTMLDAISPERA